MGSQFDTRFKDKVEWRFGGAAEPSEAGRRHHLAQPRLAGLGAKGKADLLT